MQPKVKVTLEVALLLIANLVFFGVYSYSEIKRAQMVEIETNLRMTLSKLTDYIDRWIQTKKENVTNTAYALKDVDTMSEAQIKTILQNATQASSGFDSFLGIESNGKMIYGSNTPQSVDPRTRAWYIMGKDTGKSGITDIYRSATQPFDLVSIMAPIVKNGKIIGVVATSFKLDFVVKAVNDVVFFGGYGMLLDNKKTIITHPKAEYMGKESKLSSLLKGDKEGTIEYTLEGSDKIFAYKVSSQSAWTPGIVFDKASIYEVTYKKIKDRIFVIGALIVLILIGAFGYIYKLKDQPQAN